MGKGPVSLSKEIVMSENRVNWTEEATARAVEVYESAQSDEARKEAVKALAKEFGRSEASVRMKLVSKKVYVKPEKASGSKARVRKAELVTQIAKALQIDEIELDSLEKATRKALEKVAGRVNALTFE
jgi:TRAP-type C4-dicarboxylate transport system substrate-binding protein